MLPTDLSQYRRVDVALLNKTLEFILANPHRHDQDVWAERRSSGDCGTSFCFAGWAVQLSDPGVEIVWDSDDGREISSMCRVPGCSQVIHIEDHARSVLGLSVKVADCLFAPGHTRSDLSSVVDAISAYAQEAQNREEI